MGLLVGLPLKLFHMLFVIVRVAWPVLLILLVLYVVRRRRGQTGVDSYQTNQEPTFRGPVYTVDYEEVEESDKEE